QGSDQRAHISPSLVRLTGDVGAAPPAGAPPRGPATAAERAAVECRGWLDPTPGASRPKDRGSPTGQLHGRSGGYRRGERPPSAAQDSSVATSGSGGGWSPGIALGTCPRARSSVRSDSRVSPSAACLSTLNSRPRFVPGAQQTNSPPVSSLGRGRV